jgi:hypothetical protein
LNIQHPVAASRQEEGKEKSKEKQEKTAKKGRKL